LQQSFQEVEAAWKVAETAKEKEREAQDLIINLQDELAALKRKKQDVKASAVTEALTVEEESEDEILYGGGESNPYLQGRQPLQSFDDWKKSEQIWSPALYATETDAGGPMLSGSRSASSTTRGSAMLSKHLPRV
jgi:hypothetical protein